MLIYPARTWCGLSVCIPGEDLMRIVLVYPLEGLIRIIPGEGRKIFSLFWGTSVSAHRMLMMCDDQLSKLDVELKVFWLRFLWFSWVSVIVTLIVEILLFLILLALKSVVDLRLFYFLQAAERNIFWWGGIVSPTPNPQLGGPEYPF
jgi:hypothetical protein